MDKPKKFRVKLGENVKFYALKTGMLITEPWKDKSLGFRHLSAKDKEKAVKRHFNIK